MSDNTSLFTTSSEVRVRNLHAIFALSVQGGGHPECAPAPVRLLHGHVTIRTSIDALQFEFPVGRFERHELSGTLPPLCMLHPSPLTPRTPHSSAPRTHRHSAAL